jgi:DNA-binding transcriptional ArsR family regulator
MNDELIDHSEEASEFLKSMGNPQRLKILCLLNKSPRSLAVHEINDSLQLGQSALSQHLAVLRQAGLVETRRQAQTIFYSVAPGPTTSVINILQSSFCHKENQHA